MCAAVAATWPIEGYTISPGMLEARHAVSFSMRLLGLCTGEHGVKKSEGDVAVVGGVGLEIRLGPDGRPEYQNIHTFR